METTKATPAERQLRAELTALQEQVDADRAHLAHLEARLAAALVAIPEEVRREAGLLNRALWERMNAQHVALFWRVWDLEQQARSAEAGAICAAVPENTTQLAVRKAA